VQSNGQLRIHRVNASASRELYALVAIISVRVAWRCYHINVNIYSKKPSCRPQWRFIDAFENLAIACSLRFVVVTAFENWWALCFDDETNLCKFYAVH